MVWHFYWMNSSKAIASIHWRSSRHLLLCPASLVWGQQGGSFFSLNARQQQESHKVNGWQSDHFCSYILCVSGSFVAVLKVHCIFQKCTKPPETPSKSKKRRSDCPHPLTLWATPGCLLCWRASKGKRTRHLLLSKPRTPVEGEMNFACSGLTLRPSRKSSNRNVKPYV